MRIIGLLVLFLGTTTAASAQSAPDPKGYIGGGVTVTWQPDEFADGHYLLTSTVGGVSAGAHVQAGIHLNRAVSLGAELSLPAGVNGERVRNAGGGSTTYESVQHRDAIISALTRLHFRRGTWEIQPTWGLGWVRTRTHTEGELRSISVDYPPVPLTPFTMAETRVGLTAGLDVVGHLSERVGLAPFFRLHWVQRPDSPQETTDGLPETVYRGGLLLIARW